MVYYSICTAFLNVGTPNTKSPGITEGSKRYVSSVNSFFLAYVEHPLEIYNAISGVTSIVGGGGGGVKHGNGESLPFYYRCYCHRLLEESGEYTQRGESWTLQQDNYALVMTFLPSLFSGIDRIRPCNSNKVYQYHILWCTYTISSRVDFRPIRMRTSPRAGQRKVYF